MIVIEIKIRKFTCDHESFIYLIIIKLIVANKALNIILKFHIIDQSSKHYLSTSKAKLVCLLFSCEVNWYCSTALQINDKKKKKKKSSKRQRSKDMAGVV